MHRIRHRQELEKNRETEYVLKIKIQFRCGK